jgi:hypothetical protein
MITVTPAHGFNGTVAVSISGLPAGAVAKPAAPLSINSGASQSLTVATSDSTPTGSATLTLTATSGSLSHQTTITLTMTPAVTTSQSGTVLYLQAHANGHWARIGVDTLWGGAITDVTYDGVSIVNAHDPGREVSRRSTMALISTPGLTSIQLWLDPCGGDFHGNGTLRVSS